MKKGVVIFWSVFIIAAAVRVIFSYFNSPPDIGSCLKQSIDGTGIVDTEPQRKDTGQIFVISIENAHASADHAEDCGSGALIRVKTKLYPRFAYGDRVDFAGKLSKPFNFRSDDGRTFDYIGYLAKDNVFYEIKSAVVSAEIANSNGTSISIGINGKINSALFAMKRTFVTNLESVLGEPHAALASALMVGNKGSLGTDILDDFRTVGLIHVVVLSGYHVSVVAVALRKSLGFLPKIWGISAAAFGILAFCLMVGAGSTVVRACSMAGIALSASVIRRDYNVTRALIFAGLVMAIANPVILFHDISFQLSFLATLGLVMFAKPIESKLHFLPKTLGIRGVVTASLSAQLMVSPYILYMMGQFSFIGLLVNILVLPAIPLTMLTSFIAGASGFISQTLSQWLAYPAHLVLSYDLYIVKTFAKVPYAAAHVGVFPVWTVWAFYGGLAILYVWLKWRRAGDRSKH